MLLLTSLTKRYNHCYRPAAIRYNAAMVLPRQDAQHVRQVLASLRQAGYFLYTAEDDAAIGDMADAYGLEVALFSPASGRAMPLDAEDLADGGAGMGIQQVRALLAARGIQIDAPDSEEHDGNATRLSVDGLRELLFDWSFNKRALPEEFAQLPFEPALRDLLWKSRVQGHTLEVRPCEHGTPGVDLHLQLSHGTRFLAHWGFGFDDGRVLFAINFFTIVNRLLTRHLAAERLYAWQPFTGEQSGVLLDDALFLRLNELGLTAGLRRIDAID